MIFNPAHTEGQTMAENENKATTAEPPQDVAQDSDAKAEAKATDELSEGDLEAVAGGSWSKPPPKG